MKNLILGVAKGYDWYTLEPFVNSFVKNCPSAELVLFVDDISYFTCDKLIRAGVTLKNFPYEIDGIPNNTRWKIFCDFLEVHGDEYEQIFITDTRDVIFQSDMFDRFKGFSNWLGCVTEADDIRGSKFDNNINYRWIADCFCETEADKLADRKTICCGTVIGSAAEMKIFCRELWKILEYKTTDIFDQATMNYLAYNGLLPIKNLFEFDVQSGEIFTCGLIKDNKTRGEFILRGDGGIPAVVHQYDRHDDLEQLADRIYRDKYFQFDSRFTDVRSLLEQICCLLQADKTTDAVQRFLRLFFSTVNLNYFPNLLIEIWKIASRKNPARSLEIFELAVQESLPSVEKFSDIQLINVHEILIHSAKNRHAIAPELKSSVATRLLKILEENLTNGAPEYACFRCIEMFEALELTPDENFQRLVAEVNRKFGRRR